MERKEREGGRKEGRIECDVEERRREGGVNSRSCLLFKGIELFDCDMDLYIKVVSQPQPQLGPKF